MAKETITAVIPFAKKHRPCVKTAIDSITRQVDGVICIEDVNKIGQRKMLNNMISMVKTDWILFLDADDEATPDRVKHCRPAMKNADLIYTGYACNNELCFSMPFNLEEFKLNNFIPFSTIMVRTEIAKEVPFLEDKKIVAPASGDWIWLHMVHQKYPNFLYVPKVTMVYGTELSTYKSKIPVYRKFRRLYRKYRHRKVIRELYNK